MLGERKSRWIVVDVNASLALMGFHRAMLLRSARVKGSSLTLRYARPDSVSPKRHLSLIDCGQS